MSLPWYRWYAGDWLGSPTRLDMSLAERGMYRDLLDWHYAEGSIPAAPLPDVASHVVQAESIGFAHPARRTRTSRACLVCRRTYVPFSVYCPKPAINGWTWVGGIMA